MTALGNDVGFELVFSRQLIAHGRPNDIAMGFSTSGNSDNLMRAFAEARKQGMLTVGIAGTDGGPHGSRGQPGRAVLRGPLRQRAPHPGVTVRPQQRVVGRRPGSPHRDW